MTAIYVTLVIYLAILFGVGVFYSKKNATIGDFLLAGKSLGVVAATLTLTASLCGGGLATGTPQYAYNSGSMMYVQAIVSSGGGMFLVAFLIKKMKNFSEYGTIADYLHARYNSNFLRMGSAFLSMITLIALVGSQVNAAVGIMSALGMKNTTVATVVAMVIIIALTTMGGMMAVTVTDGFQIILVIIGILWVAIAGVNRVGGYSGLKEALTAMSDTLPANYNTIFTPEHIKSLLWMILPGMMYCLIGQDIYQRLFACKSHKTAVQTCISSGVLIMLISTFPVTIGLVARVLHPELAANGTSAAAFATLAISTLPNWAVGIIVAAVLSAIFSTADSCLSAASSHFMIDLYLPIAYKDKEVDMNSRGLVTTSRIFTLVAGGAAVVVSILIPSILDACFYAYYIFTAGVFCPVVFGVFWKKATRQGAVASLVVGGVFVMFALLTGFNIGGVGGELLSGAVSAIVMVVVSLFTQPKSVQAA